MKLFFKKVIVLFFFTFNCFFVTGQTNNGEKIADYYFRSNNLIKAIEFYEKLIIEEDKDIFYQRLLVSYVKLGENKKAEELIVNQLEKNKKNPFYLADYSTFLFLNKNDEYLKWFKKTLKFLPKNTKGIKIIAKKFSDVKAYDEAILIYEKGEKILRDREVFMIEKSSLKGLNGDVQNMVSTYLTLLNDKSISVQRAQFYISRFTTFTSDTEEASQINKLLLLFAQKYSTNNDFLEMLAWFYTELENYQGAYKNLKVLYRRNPDALSYLFELGVLTNNIGDIELSSEIFNFIYNETKGASILVLEKLIESYYVLLEQNIGNTLEIKFRLDELFNELPPLSADTEKVYFIYVKYLAFYKNELNKAFSNCNHLLNTRLVYLSSLEVKFLLAELYLYSGDFTEANIKFLELYELNKDDFIGYQSKYKSALISYYNGDFEWAEIQLNVLKESTSKLISNDALFLSLIIGDNIFKDTLQSALKIYSNADYLIYQNKLNEALLKLSIIEDSFPKHQIIDEVHYLKYKVFYKKGDFINALNELLFIVSDEDNLLHDYALFYMAQLYQYQLNDYDKALETYEELLFENSNSIYLNTIKKEYRKLRNNLN